MKRLWIVGLACFLAGLVLVPVVAFLYLQYGRPPVGVADASFPFERAIVRGPLHARIDVELQQPTLQPSEQNLLAGANVYREQCAFCHGVTGKPAVVGRNMFPSAPQLWEKHRNGVVGVSDDSVGETYWRVNNGIRLTGMPSYKKVLTEDQMWQVSLLLNSAASPLSASIQTALSENPPAYSNAKE